MSDLDDSDPRDVHDLDPYEDADAHDLDDPGTGGSATDRVRLSDADERERLLAATVAHAVGKDLQYSMAPLDPGPSVVWWKWITSLGLVVVAALILLVPPGWLAGPPLPTLSRVDVTQGLEATLFLQSLEIEAFRFREGRLPRTLAELDRPFPGLRYVRSNNRVYQLVVGRADGSVLLWDSADRPPAFRRMARRWLADPPAP